ncbi:aldo/keto reductase, partial [candidate division KSB1 bacterium]|nr:aldo/keto reductase [candidate division KSB1 bacterium]
GRTGWRVSRLGFGCYRVDAVTPAHAEALAFALRNGINLIDTSTNYGEGESESLVGQVLQELITSGEIRRAEIVIVSKAGYVQGKNLALAQQREREGRPFPEMVKYMENCWHCLHPDFLGDQLDRSLARLQLDRLDVLLLHNPEYFLAHAVKRQADLNAATEEYYRRLAVALAFLEKQVEIGKISWYGISSNTFPYAATDPEFTSLERVWNIAAALTSQPHFGVIQFPFNLFETGAAGERNQSAGAQTVLDFAREKNLVTLANRPLNAMRSGSMTRLASFDAISSQQAEESFPQQIAALAAIERDFVARICPKLDFTNRLQNHDRIFDYAGQLAGGLHAFRDWAHWDYVRQYLIESQSERALFHLRHLSNNTTLWQTWEAQFRPALHAVLTALTQRHSTSVAGDSRKIAAQLDRFAPELATTPALSQKALRVLLQTEGLHAVLLGMRRRAYVEDGLQGLCAEPIPNFYFDATLWND